MLSKPTSPPTSILIYILFNNYNFSNIGTPSNKVQSHPIFFNFNFYHCYVHNVYVQGTDFHFKHNSTSTPLRNLYIAISSVTSNTSHFKISKHTSTFTQLAHSPHFTSLISPYPQLTDRAGWRSIWSPVLPSIKLRFTFKPYDL